MAERTREATRARVVARRALVLLTVTLAALLPSATDGAGALVLPSVVTPGRPPRISAASKEVPRTVTTFFASDDFTVRMALPA